ncbi:cytochrome c oxidase assembly protein [Psychrobacillus antarcticus]|uniref:cytochrome c oxidase assembly protein n=1 Tax=Psychrobacillus antarcticus TaxID=2879115 RepID=UPI002A4E2552|nr:cytochrome c oxidase assembly protein [Psychrobacillus antarcticus]
MHTHDHYSAASLQILIAFPFILLFVFYLVAVGLSNRKKRSWPVYRIVVWSFGILCAILSLIGPISNLAHTNFSAHMIGHVLLGMVAPLLMALGAPITLLLRTINVHIARRLTAILRSRPLHFVQHPIIASLLNVGGLWMLYTTDLFPMMHENMLLYVIIHVHIFLAGYVFTISIIYVDLTPIRKSYLYRSVVFLFALAGHSVLSKYIYANPPIGVAKDQAELGSMIMYYGGDTVEVGLVSILFYQWYKKSSPIFINGKEAFTINNDKKFTVVGTDIEEVKRLNANAGMSYRELNEWFARQQSKAQTSTKKR